MVHQRIAGPCRRYHLLYPSMEGMTQGLNGVWVLRGHVMKKQYRTSLSNGSRGLHYLSAAIGRIHEERLEKENSSE